MEGCLDFDAGKLLEVSGLRSAPAAQAKLHTRQVSSDPGTHTSHATVFRTTAVLQMHHEP